MATPDVPEPGVGGRRGAGSGGTSARALLLTILGELVLPTGGSAATSSLTVALGGLGVEERAARQALARLAQRGWLRSQRHGRTTRWQLTDEGDELLTDGARRIYSHGSPPARWNGRWLILMVRVPEARRQLRAQLRTRLSWAGFGNPAPGVWISPRPARGAEAAAVLSSLGLEGATSFIGTLGEIGDAATLVAAAWDLDSLGEEYRRFIAGVASFAVDDTGTSLTALLRLVHAWRRFPFIDPGLPAALLPDDWSGTRAAALFRERRHLWIRGARTSWADLERLSGSLQRSS